MSEMLHLACLNEQELAVEVTSSALLVDEPVKRLETGRFDALVFCCESAASESKMRLVCKQLTKADQNLPIFVLKSDDRTDSVPLASTRPASVESRSHTIAQILEKLRQVTRRLPPSGHAGDGEVDSVDSESSDLAIA